jgi:hypothetical protein
MKRANPSFNHKWVHHSIVTRFPNHLQVANHPSIRTHKAVLLIQRTHHVQGRTDNPRDTAVFVRPTGTRHLARATWLEQTSTTRAYLPAHAGTHAYIHTWLCLSISCDTGTYMCAISWQIVLVARITLPVTIEHTPDTRERRLPTLQRQIPTRAD